jgi:hypothetical protein
VTVRRRTRHSYRGGVQGKGVSTHAAAVFIFLTPCSQLLFFFFFFNFFLTVRIVVYVFLFLFVF